MSHLLYIKFYVNLGIRLVLVALLYSVLTGLLTVGLIELVVLILKI